MSNGPKTVGREEMVQRVPCGKLLSPDQIAHDDATGRQKGAALHCQENVL